jgi:hypothetical protein
MGGGGREIERRAKEIRGKRQKKRNKTESERTKGKQIMVRVKVKG